MDQDDFSLADTTRITTGTIIVNQSNVDKVVSRIRYGTSQTMIFSRDRGISRSRNLALNKSKADICLLCDDDEVLVSDYRDILVNAFLDHEDYDIICFNVDIPTKTYWKKEKDIGYINALKIGSWQIAIRKESIDNNDIRFDEFLGSGTNNGGGEDNKFILDCLKKGLKVKYLPIKIASIVQKSSQWFQGYNIEYFISRGVSTTHILGYFIASIYAVYFIIRKRRKYRDSIKWYKAMFYIFKGITLYRGRISSYRTDRMNQKKDINSIIL